MGLNKFSIKIFIFLVIISLLGFMFFWSISSSQLIITKIVFALLFLGFFIYLLGYLNKTNRDLVTFLNSIKHVEKISSSVSSDLSFDQLNKAYQDITNQLKDAWLEKEMEHQYFRHTIENINIGIVSFDDQGKVELFNKAAKLLLGINKCYNISDLNTEYGQIGDEFKVLKPGETRTLKLETHIDQLQILLKSTFIKIGKQQYKIVSFQDIKTQLEESELEAWQKLIKVLTHEIMNSVTPIKSLTYSMQKVLKNSPDKTNTNENLLKGLNAIEKRSKGLLDFVESYKSLTQVQKPRYERVSIQKLIENVKNLMNAEFEEHDIKLSFNIHPQDISVIADEKLITQVIVNLLLNSFKALKNVEDRLITIESHLNEDSRVCIKLSDNGEGINPEIIDKIFIPFFSTSEKGSGIGLSFVRQVMVLHNGRIDVKSKENEGATFTLIF